MNGALTADRRIRVLAGDPPAGVPPTERGASAASVLKSQVLDKGGKALVIYGGGHLSHANGDITTRVRAMRPSRIFVLAAGGGQDPVFQQFDRTFRSARRPVLVSVTSAPYDTLRSEFLDRGTKALVNGIWVDVPPNPNGRLAPLFDAFIYFGSGPDAETYVRPAP